ncbi:hypothetical protein CI238_04603, partial [Colletotrichum incanum]
LRLKRRYRNLPSAKGYRTLINAPPRLTLISRLSSTIEFISLTSPTSLVARNAVAYHGLPQTHRRPGPLCRLRRREPHRRRRPGPREATGHCRCWHRHLRRQQVLQETDRGGHRRGLPAARRQPAGRRQRVPPPLQQSREPRLRHIRSIPGVPHHHLWELHWAISRARPRCPGPESPGQLCLRRHHDTYRRLWTQRLRLLQPDQVIVGVVQRHFGCVDARWPRIAWCHCVHPVSAGSHCMMEYVQVVSERKKWPMLARRLPRPAQSHPVFTPDFIGSVSNREMMGETNQQEFSLVDVNSTAPFWKNRYGRMKKTDPLF